MPRWNGFIRQQRLTQATQHWLMILRGARALALRKGLPVELSWSGPCELKLNNKWRRTLHFPLSYVSITFRASFSRNDNLIFLADGATSGQQGSFYLCAVTTPTECQRIVVLHSGIVRLADI